MLFHTHTAQCLLTPGLVLAAVPASRKGGAGPPSLLAATTTLTRFLPSQILEFEGQKGPLLLDPTLRCCFLLINLSQTWEILQIRTARVFLLCKSIVIWMCFTKQVLVVGQASGMLKSSLNLFCVKQGLTFLLGLTQDKLEMGQDQSQTR